MPDDKDAASPGTEAFVPDFSDDDDQAEDTGTQSWVPDFDSDSDSDEEAEDTGGRPAATEPESEEPEPEVPAGPVGPVQSVTVPGRYLYVKWWKLALLLLGVWAAAAVVGLGLFSWWYNSVDKTPALFAVLVYVSLCVVGAVMLAMVHGRPLVSALSVAVLSGPFAAVAGAAPLYGYYYCERVGHCLVGVIPY
ncbi:hypothetical protein [Mycobacterium intracellulare]|uniref:hypothetical protein n=1 Tax=Mycobacterium intracellulare TaxID=1767 RepID=UPI001EEEE6A0|nr:hypothetical protein [Mycobacterium intracellulare]MEE3751302.1 hypothetical protein [Mycobacterium intracellulare]